MAAHQQSGIIEWGRMFGKAAIKMVKYSAIIAIGLIGADVLVHAFDGSGIGDAFSEKNVVLTSAESTPSDPLLHQAALSDLPSDRPRLEDFLEKHGDKVTAMTEQNFNPIGNALKWIGNLLQNIPGVDFGIRENVLGLYVGSNPPAVTDFIQDVDGAVKATVDTVTENKLITAGIVGGTAVGAYALTSGNKQSPQHQPVGHFTAAETQRRNAARMAALANGQSVKGS